MSTASATPTQQLDTVTRAALARLTGSLSPVAALLAWQDWISHLAASPGKRVELAELGQEQAWALVRYLGDAWHARMGDRTRLVEPPAQDHRFAAPEWGQWPFNLWHQSFLLTQRWWDAATRGVAGVDPHHERVVAFAARQWLDMFSPGNQLLTNPVVLERTRAEMGANLLRGAQHLIEDWVRRTTGQPPAGTEEFQVGRNLAVTPGKVVLRNGLMELIQYSPATPAVHPEPVLLVPAWIMKYYILDLSPHNSLVKYLVDQGHTVFCISWKNPTEAERDLGMDDYLEQGFFAALDAVDAICPGRKVHATGYCLGGTLLAIAAAAMARDGDARLASTTYFAAQTDFSEPGELALFIDESQVSLLEAQMAQTGYLRAEQMAGAFQMLRSYDLLWSRLVNEYLMGERRGMNDLMAWNADATRMPARMHSQYLRRLFINDDLSEGRYPVGCVSRIQREVGVAGRDELRGANRSNGRSHCEDEQRSRSPESADAHVAAIREAHPDGGRPVSLGSLRLPTFMVGTLTDHVAPWRSVHKLHHLSPAEITFALTSGGHNAGIVNPPTPDSRRRYQLLTREAGGAYLAPDDWLAAAPTHAGSWWPAWQQWLAARSGAPVAPPRMGSGKFKPVDDAPGQYVLKK